MELWGGIDSTCNRVGDRCFDQLELTGHRARASDLDLFAGLGISALRYPILWERTAPLGLDRADWRWADERLSRLRALGIRPIVGLLHHGNGPEHTSLLDPRFPEYLAAYARGVAERYPWVDSYTPVNEPLTTARFSGLYGLWHPHARDRGIFAQILLTQCRATVLAMRAIREVNQQAQLVQTEDLGTIYGTPELRYQAQYENDRRWLTFDLLCGRLDRHHPLWGWFVASGTPESDLEWFLANACPPDVIGIDHYLSSDRFQDQHLERYPGVGYASNGRHTYIDILAPRARAEDPSGADDLLATVWERYHLPVALTETHNGCTREEQMRWFLESWQGAERARERGIDVRAVTAWSLLGVQGWDALATGEGSYETGVFDIRSPQPRATAMVALLRDLSAGRKPEHPLLSVPGWWRRPVRFSHGVAVSASGEAHSVSPVQSMNRWPARQPLLIAGTGALAHACARLCDLRGVPYRSLGRSEMDIASRRAVALALESLTPWAVVNAAGSTAVEDAERDRSRCRRENLTGPEVLAKECAAHGVRLLTFSSDQVFNGRKTTPYVETDRVAPLNAYGRSQATAERRVLNALPSALVVRASAPFSPWDENDALAAAIRSLEAARPLRVANDYVTSPTYVPDLLNTGLDLLIDGEEGIWHLANGGEATWAELVTQVAELMGLPATMIRPAESQELGLPARRPAYSALDSVRGRLLPPLDDALQRYISEWETSRAPVRTAG